MGYFINNARGWVCLLVLLALPAAAAYGDICYDTGEEFEFDHYNEYSGKVYVACGSTLRFKSLNQPGVETIVAFEENSGLIVGKWQQGVCAPCGEGTEDEDYVPAWNTGTLQVDGFWGYGVTFNSVYEYDTEPDPLDPVTVPEPGDWGGVVLTSYSVNNSLLELYIHNAGDAAWTGNATWDGSALFIGGDSNEYDGVGFQNVAVYDSFTSGITCNDCTVTMTECGTNGTGGNGLEVENQGDVQILGGQYSHNAKNGILVRGGSNLDIGSISDYDVLIDYNGVGLSVLNTGYEPGTGTGNIASIEHVDISHNTRYGVWVDQHARLEINRDVQVHDTGNDESAESTEDNADYGLLIRGRADIHSDGWADGVVNKIYGNTEGGLVAAAGAEVNMDYTRLYLNHAFAVWQTNGELNMDYCRIQDNIDIGVKLQDGDMTVTNTLIEGNDALGVLMEGGVLNMSDSTVHDNADSGGYSYGGNTYYAGIFVTGADSANNSASNCNIYDNMQGSSGTYRKEFFNFALNGGGSTGAFDAQYTYWNTANPEADAIFDYDDYYGYGDVDSSNPQPVPWE